MDRTPFVSLGAAAAGLLAIAGGAQGAFIALGNYDLHNHTDGNAQPPQYGARFDEIKNVTSGTDIFTLDFNHAQSVMKMTVGATTIRIFGQSWGGIDVGNAYAGAGDAVRGPYTGLYTIDFTYTVGVGNVPGDDDKWVSTTNRNPGNVGTITLPTGAVVNLIDENMGGYSFRFGDEDNDAGHRGHPGLSGWGWMSYVEATGIRHTSDTDWLFTATLEIPTPGASALLACAGLVLMRRRR